MTKSTSIKSRLIVIALGIALGYLAKAIVSVINAPANKPPVAFAQVVDLWSNL